MFTGRGLIGIQLKGKAMKDFVIGTVALMFVVSVLSSVIGMVVSQDPVSRSNYFVAFSLMVTAMFAMLNGTHFAWVNAAKSATKLG